MNSLLKTGVLMAAMTALIIGHLLMMFVAPLAAFLIQMAISRSLEFQADATGATICGRPQSLASALKKA